ncbi:MAG: N-acetylglucosamine kinase, partial [Ktedonobacterales bacterium]
MEYVIGIDGGGTKTTAAVVGEDLGLVGSATTGPANHRSVGMEAAGANIANAVRAALRSAEVALDDVRAICLCLAGFDTDLDLPVPQRAMRLLDYTGVAILENDVVGAWSGATEASPGIVIIAGTGSTGLGMNAAGQLWRTDGWDYILGDFGSGYAIGLEAIRAAMKAMDGRAAPTLLTDKLGAAYV